MSDDAALPAAGEPPTPPGGRILLVCVAIVTAVLIAVLIILFQRSNAQRDAAQVRAQHSYEIVMLTGEVDGSLARAEASLGRFVVDGERSTGSMYYDQWRHAGIVLGRLAPLVADDAAQADRMRRLQALYAKRGEELALPAARANYKQGMAALSLFARAGRSETLPEITRLLRAVADAERERLDRRRTPRPRAPSARTGSPNCCRWSESCSRSRCWRSAGSPCRRSPNSASRATAPISNRAAPPCSNMPSPSGPSN